MQYRLVRGKPATRRLWYGIFSVREYYYAVFTGE